MASKRAAVPRSQPHSKKRQRKKRASSLGHDPLILPFVPDENNKVESEGNEIVLDKGSIAIIRNQQFVLAQLDKLRRMTTTIYSDLRLLKDARGGVFNERKHKGSLSLSLSRSLARSGPTFFNGNNRSQLVAYRSIIHLIMVALGGPCTCTWGAAGPNTNGCVPPERAGVKHVIISPLAPTFGC